MKKRTITLIEVMIVIFLITLITGAIGYNMKGSMDRGREFKTKQAKQQLCDLLSVCLDDGYTIDEIIKDASKCLKDSGLAKNPDKLIVDGWGTPFNITYNTAKKDFEITSKNLPKI